VRLRVLLVSLVLAVGTLMASGEAGVVQAAAPPTTEAPDSTVPDSTFNDFIPEEQAISDCISAVPKPGCGSEARSDYHQWLVFVALVLGMAFVGWRVVAGLRRQRVAVEQPDAPASQARR
jgi:hypothetical protein